MKGSVRKGGAFCYCLDMDDKELERKLTEVNQQLYDLKKIVANDIESNNYVRNLKANHSGCFAAAIGVFIILCALVQVLDKLDLIIKMIKNLN